MNGFDFTGVSRSAVTQSVTIRCGSSSTHVTRASHVSPTCRHSCTSPGYSVTDNTGRTQT